MNPTSYKHPPPKPNRWPPRQLADLRDWIHSLLERDPLTEMSRMQRLAARNLRVVFLVFRWDVYRRLKLHAKALTYDTLLALVPLLAVMFAVYKGFGGLDRLAPKLQALVVQNLAGSPDVQEAIGSYIDRFVSNVHTAAAGTAGLITFGVLVWSVLSLLGYIEDSFNAVFGTKAQRPLAMRLLIYWAVLTLGPVLLGASFALTAALQTSSVANVVSSLGPVRSALIGLAPIVATWVGFAIMYLVVPNARVRFSSAFFAAMVAGSLWNIAKYFYAIYTKHAFTMQSIYGSLVAIPLFILWVYLSWLLVLFGTQLTFALQHAATYRREEETIDVGQAYRERAACRLLVAVARDFYEGRGPTDSVAAAETLGVPRRLVPRLVAELVAGGFVLETEPEDRLVPATDLGNITPARLLEHLRQSGETLTEEATDPATTRLDALLGDLDSERNRLAGSVSFRDLVAAGSATKGAMGRDER